MHPLGVQDHQGVTGTSSGPTVIGNVASETSDQEGGGRGLAAAGAGDGEVRVNIGEKNYESADTGKPGVCICVSPSLLCDCAGNRMLGPLSDAIPWREKRKRDAVESA